MVNQVLDSVAAQTDHDFEVIAIDDGSSDDTLQNLKRRDDVAKVIEITNGGPGRARNQGAKAATGRYLAFLDSDDLWFPHTLSYYRKIIDRYCNPSVVTIKPVFFSDPCDVCMPAEITEDIREFTCYNEAYQHLYWQGVSSFLVRRDVFHKVGGFSDKRMNAEDADLMLKLGTSPRYIHIESPPLFAYRWHSTNITNNISLCVSGLLHLIESEEKGNYPGGQEHARNRHVIITRHIRPLVISAIRDGSHKVVRSLFLRTFFWNLREGRLRYLLYCIFRYIFRF